MNRRIYKRIATRFPGLKLKLQQAGMEETEVTFVRKTFLSAFYMTFGITFVAAMFLSKTDFNLINLLLVFPILMFLMFMYFIKMPDIKKLHIEREINGEIVDAGRFLIIELESGIPVYDAFKHVARNYPVVGKYFKNIVEDIDLGTAIEEALNRAVDIVPSRNFRKLLWQIINSIGTGADIAKAISSVIEQVVREQKIELNEYGRKLNPLAMFYMIVAVVLPSIGITMLVVMVSFLSINLTLGSLLMIAGMMGFIQFMFFNMVKRSRPASQIE